MKVRNTTEEVKNNPLLGLMEALDIPAQERRGQSELINSTDKDNVFNLCQLPSKWNTGKENSLALKEQYEAMGIKVIGDSKGDKLFLDVELPIGWQIKNTDHSMWNELVDDKGRVRATFFYKAAFYDRDAFINFDRRYNFTMHDYLPTSEKGHYEMQKVKYRNNIDVDIENIIEQNGKMYFVERNEAWGTETMYPVEKYTVKEEKVWIPKYKDSYQERNNTPMYFEITDGNQVIFSTKDSSVYFKKRYAENYHQKWWKEFEAVKDNLRQQAIKYLNDNFPEWDSTNSYWN